MEPWRCCWAGPDWTQNTRASVCRPNSSLAGAHNKANLHREARAHCSHRATFEVLSSSSFHWVSSFALIFSLSLSPFPHSLYSDRTLCFITLSEIQTMLNVGCRWWWLHRAAASGAGSEIDSKINLNIFWY